jgi:ribonucleotide reductase alpha subunit
MAIKISYLNEKEDVYDVTVEDNHNFYANGILVHNCSEIILPTNKERTAVCCLSSLNLEHFHAWKNNKRFLKDVAEFLDNVLQYFIDNAPDQISRARFSAFRERSIGIGALGFHAFLQSMNIPFESAMAKSWNINMFKLIRAGLDTANKELGAERGEAPDIESEIMFLDDNGNVKKINSKDFVNVERNKKNIYIRAFQIEENDIILDNNPMRKNKNV